MSRDEVLLEIQRRIAERKGWTDLISGYPMADGTLAGTLPDEEDGVTLVPRWPQDWCDGRELVEELCARPNGRLHVKQVSDGYIVESFEVDDRGYPWLPSMVQVGGESIIEAIARCWCAWQGIDLSDLEVSAP